jgi:hypothetical protein
MYHIWAFFICFGLVLGCSSDSPSRGDGNIPSKGDAKGEKKEKANASDEDEDEDEEESPSPSPSPDPGNGDFPKARSLALFQGEVHDYIKASCGRCHSPTTASVSPLFAQDSAEAAHDIIVAQLKVDFNDVTSSRLYKRLGSERHNCPQECTADAARMREMLVKWIDTLNYRVGGVQLKSTGKIKLTATTDGPVDAVAPTDVVVLATAKTDALANATTINAGVDDEVFNGAMITSAIRFANGANAISGQNVNCANATPPLATAGATYTVNVTNAGEYAVYLRARTGMSGAATAYNTVCIRVNGGNFQLVTFPENTTTFKWLPAQSSTTSPIYTFNLNAGANTIAVFGKGAANRPVTNNAPTPMTTQVTFNRLAVTTKVNVAYEGRPAAAAPPKEVSFDLKGITGKDAKLFLSVNKFDDQSNVYGVSRLRLETNAPIRMEGIDILVNGRKFDFNKIYRGVKFNATAAGPAVVSAASSVIQGENGFEQDEISLTFEVLE